MDRRCVVSMQLRISHRTGFSYGGGAAASYNEARMTPLINSDQFVLSSDLDVSPVPWSFSYVDYWGTLVTAFELHERHDELTVTANSTVTVDRAAPSPDQLTWQDLDDPVLRDQWCEMLEMSHWVDTGDDLAARVRDIRADSANPGVFVRSVCELLYDEIEYIAGATEVTTVAEQAWDAKAGVCQDLAHLTIGCLRSQGVPVRYVSGYLHPSVEPQIEESVVGESHAWVEWWDGEWKGFDPTNAIAPGNRHVVVGYGRTYADCAPLRGVFSTTGDSQMFVEVDITRVS